MGERTSGTYRKASDRMDYGEFIMTIEALREAIGRLLIARREADGNQVEQDRITAKLTKLYDLKYTMLEQQAKGE